MPAGASDERRPDTSDAAEYEPPIFVDLQQRETFIGNAQMFERRECKETPVARIHRTDTRAFG
jgi:hypothetical protein